MRCSCESFGGIIDISLHEECDSSLALFRPCPIQSATMNECTSSCSPMWTLRSGLWTEAVISNTVRVQCASFSPARVSCWCVSASSNMILFELVVYQKCHWNIEIITLPMLSCWTGRCRVPSGLEELPATASAAIYHTDNNTNTSNVTFSRHDRHGVAIQHNIYSYQDLRIAIYNGNRFCWR
jgi:hypothetical protein